MERRLLTLLAETPVHAGGPESLAAVDLPIQREAATGLPVIWGQSLKGALRQAWRDAGLREEKAVFGSRPPRRAGDSSTVNDSAGDDAAGDDAAGDDLVADAGGVLTRGAISVGDAQLMLFPVATLREVFGWVTSPLLLSRLGRKLRLLDVDPGTALAVPNIGGHGLGTSDWAGRHVIGPFVENIQADARPGTIGAVLGALVCPCPGEPTFDYTRRKMSADVLLVGDSTIRELARMGTDVVARVQLDETEKTARNLFYSEHLPAETVLAALLTGTGDHLDRLATLLDGQPLQLGGDETVGKGVLWCRVHSAASSGAVLAGVAAESATDEIAATPDMTATELAGAVAPAAPAVALPAQHPPSPAMLARRKHA